MIDLSSLKLAAYLNEAHDDPIQAIGVLANHGIKSVCIRNMWSTNVCNLPDDTLSNLKEALTANGMNVALVCSMLGEIEATRIGVQDYERLERATNVCQFLGCKHLKLSIGKAERSDKALQAAYNWMEGVSNATLTLDIMPVFELCHNYHIDTPVGFVTALNKYKRWSAIYDPAALVMHRKIDPFTKYWTLLKGRVSHIDIHDYKIGSGPRAPGHGDGKIDLVLSDAITSNFQGWFCLEPGLGRRHGDRVTYEETFSHAFASFKALLDRLSIGGHTVQKSVPWHKAQK